MHFEEDTVFIALPILKSDDYWQVPSLDEESPMQQFSLTDEIRLLREAEPRPIRSYFYAPGYEGELIHETIFPCMLTATEGVVPSSYLDDQIQESANGRREQWMMDSGTTFHIIGHDEATARGYQIVPLPTPVSLSTASGQVWARDVAEITGPGALEPLNAFVLSVCSPCL